MKYICSFFVFFIFSISAVTPTEKYLAEFSFEEISQEIEEQGEIGFKMGDYYPLFQKAIAAEDETFFGYHATTIDHLLYQEITKAMLEKIFEERFRSDFYFLRTPGQEFFNINNKNDFFHLFAPKPTTPEKRKFVQLYFIDIIEKISGTSFPHIEVDESVTAKIYKALAYSLPSKEVSKEKTFEILYEFLKNSKLEEREFLCFENALMRWIECPKKHFHEASDYSHKDEKFVRAHLSPYNDTQKQQQRLLISLNTALFAHHTLPPESTVHIFASGQSVDIDSIDFEKKMLKELQNFASMSGFSAAVAKKCIELTKDVFELESGVLLQFFAPSSSSLDEVTYLCSTFGEPLRDESSAKTVSEYLVTFDPKKFEKLIFPGMAPILLHPQVRLLATNSETLNPYSWLKVKVYTTIPEEKLFDFQQSLRELLERHPPDQQKSAAFKKELENQWF